MLIQQEQEGSKGAFFVQENDERLAEMTYTMSSDTLLIIDHTEVSPQLRGKNAGYQLVEQAVEYARAKDLKIFPLCPFARSVFEKNSAAFADVLRSN